MNNQEQNTIYKLSTGEKVNTTEVEKLIASTCHYVKFVSLAMGESNNNVALIIPNRDILDNPDYKLTPEEGCFCPRNLHELGRCLTGCLKKVNKQLDPESEKIDSSILIKVDTDELGDHPTNENMNGLLKKVIKNVIGGNHALEQEIYYIHSLS